MLCESKHIKENLKKGDISRNQFIELAQVKEDVRVKVSLSFREQKIHGVQQSKEEVMQYISRQAGSDARRLTSSQTRLLLSFQ